MTCPECNEARYISENSVLKARRTTRQLEVAPQLASLFTSNVFLKQCENPIEDVIKGSYIKELKAQGLFQGKYDIAVTLYNDGFQTHGRGGTKLNTIQLQILNLPEDQR